MPRPLALFVASIFLAAPFLKASAAESVDQKIERLHDRCRGGSGDDPKTMKACDERDRLIKSQAKQKPEYVSLFLPHNGKNGDTYDLDNVALIAYPERPCGIQDIPNYQRMRTATMSRVPMCYFKSNGRIILLGPHIGVQEYPEVMFAVARVNQDGESATVTHPGFDSEVAQKRYIEGEEDRSRRMSPGYPLPPRDSIR